MKRHFDPSKGQTVHISVSISESKAKQRPQLYYGHVSRFGLEIMAAMNLNSIAVCILEQK